jgi:SAM-dependent methyltransferase
MWSAVACSWADNAAFVDRRHVVVSERMLQHASPRPGERVLELACGPGGVGLAAATLVGPGGEVVLSDVAVEMTEIALTRADALGLTNVSTAVLDLEAIDEPDDSYDVVLCRDGLQFATDPLHAMREVCRVLRPGGRASIAVWGPRIDNPWLGIVFDVVSAQLGRPVPPPGVPGPFSLGDARRLTTVLTTAGLTDAGVAEVAVPMQASSFEAWWAVTTALAGPLALMLSTLPAEAGEALRSSARQAVEPYVTDSRLDIPGVALLGTARR